MEGVKNYYLNKRRKKILNRELDLPISILSNDIAYNHISSDFRSFLHGNNSYDGFLNGFNEIRKSNIERAYNLYQENYSKEFIDPEKLVESIRSSSRYYYWKTKDYISKNLKEPQVIGQESMKVPYEVGETTGIQVHHLNRLKSFINNDGIASLKDAMNAVDAKYQVAMTDEAHLRDPNIGHAGNFSNNPKINNPFDIPDSIPNDYYRVLKEKRADLIEIDLNEGGLYTGVVSLLILMTLNKSQKSNNALIRKLQNEKIFLRLSAIGFGVTTRESLRDIIHDSKLVQESLFELRDIMILANNKYSSLFSDELLATVADIDLLADSASIAGFSIVFQLFQAHEQYRKTGSIDYIDQGSQMVGKTVIIGGGKYLLTAAGTDPTGASLIIAVVYIGGNFLYRSHRAKFYIRIEGQKRISTRDYINNQIDSIETLLLNEVNNELDFSTPSGAVFSESEIYRYALWRVWDNSKPLIMFIGLNPSTADEIEDDQTVRICTNFVKRWGYGGFILGNLFAYRTKDPQQLKMASDPVGTKNEYWLLYLAQKATKVIAVWGNHGNYKNRSDEVKNLFDDLYYLDLNKTGEPSHPIGLKVNIVPKKFT